MSRPYFRETLTPAYWYQTAFQVDTTPANDCEQPELDFVLDEGYSLTQTIARLHAALMGNVGTSLIYQQARRLVRVVRGVPGQAWLTRDAQQAVIAPAGKRWVQALAQRAGTWVRLGHKGAWIATHPTMALIETLMEWEEWDFPVLAGIIEAPTLRPDGTPLDQPGYDEATGLYLDTTTVFPPLLAAPTQADAQAALEVLKTPLRDCADTDDARRGFCFAAEHDRAAALAALLTLICRPTLGEGCTPLFGVTATTRASGKGLLCDLLATIATGHKAPKWAPMPQQDEERKALFTLALEGSQLACIDNCLEPLGSPALDMAITTALMEGRILGKSEKRRVPWRVVLFATGNNLRYKGDLARRVIPIALDPKMEHPELREGIRYPGEQLLAWAREQRPRLVVAALTIVQAYMAAGCPDQGITPLGSFEEWSRLIRCALMWAGTPDPCAGRADIEDADEDFGVLAELLQAWQDCYGEAETTLKAVVQDLELYRSSDPGQSNKWDTLRDALGALDVRDQPKQPLNKMAVGKALAKHEGRIIEGRVLRRAQDVRGQEKKDRTGKVLWTVKVHGALRDDAAEPGTYDEPGSNDVPF